MLITMRDGTDVKKLQSWLIRRGIESRALEGGRLLIEDPYLPFDVVQSLEADPLVHSLEATRDLPRRVLRKDLQDAPWPFAGRMPSVIAGPCSLESESVAFEVADFLASQKLEWMRGGTHKVRTSPYSFQGAGLQAADWLRTAADRYGLKVISEVVDTPEMEAVAELLDAVQVGARQMHNPQFLERVAACGKPVLLKRGLAATPDEWLWAAEYLLTAGAPYVMFCERGIRSFNPLKRFTLDLAAVPFVRTMTPYPIFVDPSHAAGYSPWVSSLGLGAIAAGANGLLVECHPDPACARSDAAQALDFPAMTELIRRVRSLNLQEVTP